MANLILAIFFVKNMTGDGSKNRDLCFGIREGWSFQ